MRISISNIAWELPDEPAVARLLAERGIDRVDIAPGKYFADPDNAKPGELAAVRRLWAERGCRIEGMQALLFGTTGLNLFADEGGAMRRRLISLCRIAGGIGARALTFGSPRQRDRGALTPEQALEVAVPVFRAVGDAAAAEGVVYCLEPNPAAYGCNFMTTTAEAAAVVRAIDHPAVRVQLDVGAIAMNAEPVAETIATVAPLIGHIHASEPMLATLGDAGAPHAAAAAAIRAWLPDHVVTIEMATAKTEPPIAAVARALDLAMRTYGDRA